MSQNDRDPWSFDSTWSRVKAREWAKARQSTPPAPLPTEPGPASPAVPSLTVSEPSEQSSTSTPNLISLLLVATTSGLAVHLYTQRDELLPAVQRRTQALLKSGLLKAGQLRGTVGSRAEWLRSTVGLRVEQLREQLRERRRRAKESLLLFDDDLDDQARKEIDRLLSPSTAATAPSPFHTSNKAKMLRSMSDHYRSSASTTKTTSAVSSDSGGSPPRMRPAYDVDSRDHRSSMEAPAEATEAMAPHTMASSPSVSAQHVIQGMYSPRSRNTLPAVTLLQYEWLALMDNAEYPVIGMTTRGVVTFWNPCAERVSGLKADTLVGEPLLFKHAEDGARLRQALLATTQDGTTTKLEDVQLYYEDRTVGYWSMLVSPLKPEGVEVSTEQALVLCTDNTFARRIESEVEPLQRKVQKLFAAHEAMMEANEVLRGELLMHFKYIQQPVFALNRELALVYVNDAMEQLTGYSADNLRSMQFVDQLVPPEVHEAMHDALVSVIHEGTRAHVDTKVMYAGGKRGVWAVALSPGNGMGAFDVLAVCVDLTPDHQRSNLALQNKKLALQLSRLQASDAVVQAAVPEKRAPERRTSLMEFLELERRIKDCDPADLDDISKLMSRAADELTGAAAEDELGAARAAFVLDCVRMQLELEQSAFPAFVLNHSLHVELWNAAAAAATGRPRQQVLGLHVDAVLGSSRAAEDLKSLIKRPPGSTMDTTLRLKCPNGAQLQWQTLCSCSVPLDGFDSSGPVLVCRATEQHTLTAASSSATSTPMGQGSSSRKVPSPLRSLHSHGHGGSGVDNPLGLSYLATARAEAEAEDEQQQQQQQRRGGSPQGGPRTFGLSPSDGEGVLKALKEYGIYDARWAAKNVYMIQGKRVYITQRSGEYVVRVGGSVVPIANFVEQLHHGLDSDTLDALDWVRANAPPAATAESSSTKSKTQSRSHSRSSTPDNLRSSLSRSSTPGSAPGTRSAAYNTNREASVSLRSGYNATARSTETAFGAHTTSASNMHPVSQSRGRSATGSGVSSTGGASSRLGSPVEARTQGNVRGTSPSSFDPAFGVKAYPRLSADIKPQAGHKRWL